MVTVVCTGEVSDFLPNEKKHIISWTRTIEQKGGKTTQNRAKEMQRISTGMQQAIRENRGIIPVLAYYSDQY